mgnify:FL=1
MSTVQGGLEQGLLRDYRFKCWVQHASARVRLAFNVQWQLAFIDPRDVQAAQAEVKKLGGSHKKYPPLQRCIAFTDTSGAGVGGGAGGKRTAAEVWADEKSVTMDFSYIDSTSVNLTTWCQRCIVQTLTDPLIASVDHETNLRALRVGRKVPSPQNFSLGGHRSFSYEVGTMEHFDQDAKETVAPKYMLIIGTVVANRGYMLTITCAKRDELLHYAAQVLIPVLSKPVNLELNADVVYTEAQHPQLAEQQDYFGELRYFDSDAEIEFSVPVHPLTLRPDYSPMLTAGVGSLCCVTLTMDVYQRLLDDMSDADTAAMQAVASHAATTSSRGGHGSKAAGGGGASGSGGGGSASGSSGGGAGSGGTTGGIKQHHRFLSVVLFIEVEDLLRMGFPAVLSTDSYSQMKLDKLLATFPNSRQVGKSLSSTIGKRSGKAVTTTFTYNHHDSRFGQGVVKATTVSCIHSTNGASVTYFTKLGQGVYDSYVYVLQHVLRSVRFYSKRELTEPFSRFQSTVIRLTEQDLPRCYPKDGSAKFYDQHIAAIRTATDGSAEDATKIITVSKPAAAAALALTGEFAAASGGGSLISLLEDPPLSTDEATADAELREMIISVTTIPHLNNREIWEEEGGAASSGGQAEASVDTGDAADATAAPSPAEDPMASSSIARRRSSVALDVHSLSGGGAEAAGNGTSTTTAAAGTTQPSTTADPTAAGETSSGGAAAGSEGGTTTEDGIDGVAAEDGSTPEARPPAVMSTSIMLDWEKQLRELKYLDPHQCPLCGKWPTTRSNAVQHIVKVHMKETSGFTLDKVHLYLEQVASEQGQVSTATVEEMTAAMQPDPALEKAQASGPSLKRSYLQICESQRCRPNSYLTQKLPDHPRFTDSIDELDMSHNYVGHNGFMAILVLLTERLSRIHTVHFNSMGLDNQDAEHMAEMLASHPSLKVIHMRQNQRLTLPASKSLFKLLRLNPRIATLTLSGSSIGEALAARIELEAQKPNRSSGAKEALHGGAAPAVRIAHGGSAAPPPAA